MATLLAFHILGLYPVPSSSQYLVLSPFTPKYTIHNPYLNVSTTVTAVNFDANSIRRKIPVGSAAYVESVEVNSVRAASTCHVDFYDTFRVGGNITITLTADKDAVTQCNGTVPDSLSSGMYQ
jgi:hypothetical protein